MGLAPPLSGQKGPSALTDPAPSPSLPPPTPSPLSKCCKCAYARARKHTLRHAHAHLIVCMHTNTDLHKCLHTPPCECTSCPDSMPACVCIRPHIGLHCWPVRAVSRGSSLAQRMMEAAVGSPAGPGGDPGPLLVGGGRNSTWAPEPLPWGVHQSPDLSGEEAISPALGVVR